MHSKLSAYPWAKFILVPLLYYTGAQIGIYTTIMPEGMVILWLPNSVLLAAFIIYQGRHLLAFAALAMAAEIAADIATFSFFEAVLFGSINIMEACVAFFLLTHWRFNSRMNTLPDLLKFVLAGPLVGAFIAAVCGALTYSYFRGAETGYFEFLRIWWFGDALGLMILTPLLLGLWHSAEDRPQTDAKLRPLDGLVAAAALFVTALFIISQDGDLYGMQVGPVLFLPFVIYVAVRFDMRWVAVAVTAVAFLIMTMMTSGRNPFGVLPPSHAVIAAQEFIFIMSLMALGLSALLVQLRSKQHEIEQINKELEEKAESLNQNVIKLQQAEAEVSTLNINLEQRVKERTRELEEALTRERQLQGLLPICSWCKKIRDDENYWHSVEEYITDRTGTEFSHGICPECRAKHFTDL